MRHDCTREIEAATAPLRATIAELRDHLSMAEDAGKQLRATIVQQMPRRRVVLVGDGDLGNSAPRTTPEREAASAARIWPNIDGGVE
jgi:hypothetical protein